MKAKLLTLCVLLGLSGWAMADGTAIEMIGESTFQAITKDGEVEDVSDIKIEQSFPSAVTWTLSEIDYYISYHQMKIEESQGYINKLKDLRTKVEEATKKVQLKSETPEADI